MNSFIEEMHAVSSGYTRVTPTFSNRVAKRQLAQWLPTGWSYTENTSKMAKSCCAFNGNKKIQKEGGAFFS